MKAHNNHNLSMEIDISTPTVEKPILVVLLERLAKASENQRILAGTTKSLLCRLHITEDLSEDDLPYRPNSKQSCFTEALEDLIANIEIANQVAENNVTHLSKIV